MVPRQEPKQQLNQADNKNSRSYWLLLFALPFLCSLMFCASQIAIWLSFPGVPPSVAANSTADYSPWDFIRFLPINPQIETEIALDRGSNEIPVDELGNTLTPTVLVNVSNPRESTTPIAVADNPTATASATPTDNIPSETPTTLPSQTDTASPTATETLVASETPTLTATTQTETPTNTAIANPVANATATNVVVNPPPVAPSVDVSMSLVSSNTTPIAGQTITVTASILNSTSVSASAVSANILFGSGLTYVSASGTGTFNGSTWNVGAVPANSAVTLQMIVVANTGGTSPSITGSITVVSPGDSNFANNNASVMIAIQPAAPTDADMALSMSVSPASVAIGDAITYTLTATNNGPVNASNVMISQTLPAGVTFVSSSGCTAVGQAVSCNLGALANGTSSTVTVNAQTSTTGTLNSTTNVSASEADLNTANNNASASITVDALVVDLDLVKAVSSITPAEDSTITYTVTLTNNGPNTATNIVIDVGLPTGVTFVLSSPSGGTYDAGTSRWSIASLGVGSNLTLNLTATVNSGTAGTTLTATSTVVSLTENDPTPASATVDISSTPALAYSDLITTLSGPTGTVNAGNNLSYFVTIRNSSAVTATNVAATVNITPVISINSASGDGTFDTSTNVWTIGTLLPGQSANLIFSFRVPSTSKGNSITIDAGTSSFDQSDSNLADNVASLTFDVRNPGLAISKSASNNRPIIGDTIIYTVQVSNDGIVPYTGVQVTDNLPSGITYVSHTSDQGTYNLGTGIWDIGDLAQGASVRLRITVTVDLTSGGANINNIASITSYNETDPYLANNSASRRIRVQVAGLALSKRVSNSNPAEGENITYTVRINSRDVIDYTSVQVTDVLPLGVTFVSYTADQGVYASGTGIWDVGTVVAGSRVALYIVVQVDTGTIGASIENVANITATTPGMPVGADTQGAATITPSNTPPFVDITMNLDDAINPDPVFYDEGDIINLVATARNRETTDATGITAQINTPSQLTFVNVSSTDYDSTTGVWTIGDLTSGQRISITISYRVNGGTAGQSFTVDGAITAVDQPDADTSNDTSSEPFTIVGTDLAVTKTVNNVLPYEGNNITYTVSVSNTGRDTTDVRVRDQLPFGVTYVSHTTATGTYDNVTGEWVVGDMLTGSSAQLDIVALVNAGTVGGTITNTAMISNFTQIDTNLTNNSASVSISPQVSADVAITLDDVIVPNPMIYDEGDVIDIQATLSNNGPNDATGITVQFTVPTQLTFVSSASGGYDSTTNILTVGNLNAGQTTNWVISYRVNPGTAGQSFSITGAITNVDQDDPNNPNNSSDEFFTVSGTDLAVTMTVDDATPYEGNTIMYSVSVTNTGRDTTDVRVTDNLPIGVTYVSHTTATGTFDNTTGEWIIGNMITGGSAQLDIIASVNSGTGGSTISNTATISNFTQPDTNLTNNSASVSISPQTAVVDLALTKTANPTTVTVGDTFVYTLTVTNNGPAIATGVTISDILPAEVSFVSSVSCTHAIGVVTCSIGSLAIGASQVVTVQAQADTAGSPVTNSASVTSTQSDTNTSNNATSASVTVDPAVVVADTGISMVVSTATPNENDTITYDVTINNAGPSVANNTQVAFVLPPQVTFSSTTTGQGTFSGTTWSAGNLISGGSTTMQLNVTVNTGTSGQMFDVSATISSDETDSNTTNNTSSVSVIVN